MGDLPLVGLGKLTPTLGAPPHRKLAQLASEHGAVMKVQMGQEQWLVLSSPEAVHEAFRVKGSDFSGRPMVTSMGISAGGGRSGFARAQLNKELKVLRQLAMCACLSHHTLALV